jgi:hypothetical protein
VIWEGNKENILDAIELRISNQPLKLDERGVILSSYPKLESLAYRLSAYIANSVYKQTGFDAIDPETVVGKTPELCGETTDEENMLASRGRTVGSSRRISYSIRGSDIIIVSSRVPRSMLRCAAIQARSKPPGHPT